MKAICRFSVFGLMAFIAGCGGLPGTIRVLPEPESGPPPGYIVVKTYFSTDRNITGSSDPNKMFGADRSMLSFGSCEVSIPRNHRMGELESPSIWRLEFRENPSKHVVLLSAALCTKDSFFTMVSDRVGASKNRNAFIFVHGYNVAFKDAARRTAQMSYDLAFEGAPVFYSWPSRGEVAAYTPTLQSFC